MLFLWTIRFRNVIFEFYTIKEIFSDKTFHLLLSGLTIANIVPVMMLGRKQSLKGEPVLADYGPEESLNESADIEWVNKVSISRKKKFINFEKVFF